jgi:ATP synthase protein I
MAEKKPPEKPHDGREPGPQDEPETVGDLDARRKSLDAALAARKTARHGGSGEQNTGGSAGYGQALKLSSEFIAGVLVGAGLGFLLDRFAGTAPWGMIIFLLLGFAAGVLNVLRSAGVVAQPENRTQTDGSSGVNEDQ